MTTRKTLVGNIDSEVLMFTARKDTLLDLLLAEVDCIGTAAHVTMLSRMRLKPAVISSRDRRKVIAELIGVIKRARAGTFKINIHDQDVHLAVENMLTNTLGDVGRRIHTARSRNDQVSVDLRLYGKEQLLQLMDEVLVLAGDLLRFAFKNASLPMVGRTHLQPAMPSSVGLWASAYTEGLIDDMITLRSAYDFNDRCPLGAAAGFGVPLPIDRDLTSRLLGFAEPVHNVLYACNARGKCESVILASLSHIMVTVSRLAEDMILYSMPEFGYFSLPSEFCTGSSIMPQKKNPDVLELVRAKAFAVMGYSTTVAGIMTGLPGGYNRDLQEAKEPFIEGIHQTRACVRIMARMMQQLKANAKALRSAFTPEVFAADKALELVVKGVPFRSAYDHVKLHLSELKCLSPDDALSCKKHLGAPDGLDFGFFASRIDDWKKYVKAESRHYHGAIARLLGVKYPNLERT